MGALEEDEDDEAEEEDLPKSFRIWRITESAFNLFLKGSSSEFASTRRRFFLSAIATTLMMCSLSFRVPLSVIGLDRRK